MVEENEWFNSKHKISFKLTLLDTFELYSTNSSTFLFINEYDTYLVGVVSIIVHQSDILLKIHFY